MEGGGGHNTVVAAGLEMVCFHWSTAGHAYMTAQFWKMKSSTLA